MKSANSSDYHIPGGAIEEDEFLKAATQSGSAKIQLQLAARAATGSNVSEATGIDLNVTRLKPAVLEMNPRADAEGKTPLKNEYESKGDDECRLYYFLQVSEEDFIQQVSFSICCLSYIIWRNCDQFTYPHFRHMMVPCLRLLLASQIAR